MLNIKNVYNSLYFSNSKWLLIEKVFRIFVNIFVFGKVAQYLGTSLFGTFSYYQNFILTFIPLWSLGINQILKKYIATHPESGLRVIAIGFKIKFSMALIIFSSFLLFSYLAKNQETLLVVALSLSYLFRSSDVVETWLDSSLKSGIGSIAKSVTFFLTSALYLFAIHQKLALHYFGLIFSFEFILLSLVYFLIYKQHRVTNENYLQLNFKQLIIESIPLLICDVLITLQLRMPHYFLMHYHSSESVGIYSIALRLSELWYFLPAALTLSLYTPLIQSKNNDYKKYIDSIRLLFKSLFFLWFSIFICFSLAAPFIIKIFFNIEYLKSLTPLYVLLAGNLFVFWGYAQEPIEIAEGIISFRVKRMFFGFLINIGACFALIPQYKEIGASLALFVSYMTSYFLVNLFSKRLRHILKAQLFFFKI